MANVNPQVEIRVKRSVLVEVRYTIEQIEALIERDAMHRRKPTQETPSRVEATVRLHASGGYTSGATVTIKEEYPDDMVET